MIDGTKTAGETAPRQNPLAKHNGQGRSKNAFDITATMVASTIYGTNVSKATVKPIPLNSSSKPPLIRMILKHIYLIQSAHNIG